MKMTCFGTAVLLFSAMAASAASPAGVTVSGASDPIAPGAAGTIAVAIKMNEGWHIQAHEPLDPYASPTDVQWGELPAGITLGEDVYPEPATFRLEGTDEDILVLGPDFTIDTPVTVAESVAPGTYTLAGTLAFQACDDKTCIAPDQASFEVALVVGDGSAAATASDEWKTWESVQGGPAVQYRVELASESVAPGGALSGTLHLKLDGPWHANAHEPLDQYLIPTEVGFPELPDGVSVGAITYPEPHTITIAASPEPMAVYSGEFSIAFELKVADDMALGEVAPAGALTFQACNDKACFPPQTKTFNVAFVVGEGSLSDAVAGADGGTEPEVAVVADARLDDWNVIGQASGYMPKADFLGFLDAVESGVGNKAGLLASIGVFWIILTAFGGGLALNLTPCVLPIIPINLAIIGAGRKAESKSRGFVLGLAYGLGIALVFGGLGLAFVLGLASFGGTINQSPWFNLGITILFIALALAMFDLITIDFSKWQSNINAAGKGGSVGFALFMGGVSALLAGACVAPVLVAVLLYSQDQFAKGNVFALGLPFLLGLGMALPWPIVGAGVGLLPKPGAWMTKVKYVFGVVILVIAGIYGWTTYKIFDNRSADPAEVVESVKESGWETDFDTALAKAEAEGKPVFIDFWATWCKNCLAMNKTVFKDEEVLDRLDGYVKLKYQAEVPGDEPHASVLAGFDQYVSFPFYAVIEKK